MRFFRVHFYDDSDGCSGFKFFTAQADAAREANAWKRDATKNRSANVEAMEFEPTKAGILDILNRFATHPDNG